MNQKPAKLILEDGSEYSGYSFGKAKSQAGDVVFSTAMTGFHLSLTDPAYRGQILVAAYPLVTDNGIPVDPKTGEAFTDSDGLPDGLESPVPQIAGFAVSELCADPGLKGATLSAWLEKNNVPGIFGIDTRALVQRLRDNRTMRGKILVEGSRDVTLDSGLITNPVAEVSAQAIHTFTRQDGKAANMKIALLDLGTKASVIRCLLDRGMDVIRLPWNHDLKGVDYDGLVLSGGPGDPKAAGKTIAALRRAFDNKKPIFGLGLGCQIMALAAGADTYRLPFGHRGANQPCLEKGGSRCYITSQNHGYSVREDSLPKDWECSFVNANDNSVEGIRSRKYPFMAVEFRPEGCPGPRDTDFLFDRFADAIKESK